MLVALSGRKRSGKDTAANLLAKELGFKRIAFADKLKELTASFLGFPLAEVMGDKFKELMVAEVLTDDEKVRILYGRDVLQKLGVACRDTFGEHFWVEQLFNSLHMREHNYVITDCRFWNEVEAVQRWSGSVIRVNRTDSLKTLHNWFPEIHADGYPLPRCVHPGCNLPKSSHPTHSSGDNHPSETTLPDSSPLYDAVFTSPSGEETAQAVLSYVKSIL